MPQLTSRLTAVDSNYRKEYEKFELADPHFNVAGKIDIILGADIYKDILLSEVRKGSLLAQKTHLGWILSGALRDDAVKERACFFAVSNMEEEWNNTMKQFWKTEEKVTPISKWSADEYASVGTKIPKKSRV